MAISVLVADDHPTFRTGLSAVLSAARDIEVVGEAADGLEAIELATALRPDVVLLDLRMPGLDGISACRRIAGAGGRVVILTMSGSDESIYGCLRAGALGYLLKDATPSEIATAVRAAASGGALFGPSIANRLPHYFEAPGPARPFPELTNREVEVLAGMAVGMADKAIANSLSLSTKTVRNYVSSILAKLEARDRTHAVAMARDAGLGPDSD